MKTEPEKLVQMERYMMKLLIAIMAVTALAASVPLYMLHEADSRARMAEAPAVDTETSVVR